ncbi:MAG: PD-(D/E)XK nuclease family protein, partial [Planctomycetales bacterium]|nr:PD-(D/E)XK nuclease family protein [Planctomycetales bacterium]
AVFYDALDEPYEALRAVKPQSSPTPAVEFMLAPLSDPDAPQEVDDAAVDATPAARPRKRDGRIREATWIARRLRQLLHDQTPIVVDAKAPGGVRALRMGDVAILFRALSDVAIYEDALRSHGIDYHLAGGHAFYSQQEVFDVLNLLRAVHSAIDEPALAGALRSPFFALTDESLYWLVENFGSLTAAIAGKRAPEQLGPHESEKFLRAAETLEKLRRRKDRLLVAELIQEAMALTGYDAALQAEFLGDRKLANLEKLIEQARRLDRTAPGDLAGYLVQLGEFVSRPPKEALAAVQAEGDAVRLMTIHHAKGLEFPFVVVPDLDRTEHQGMLAPVVDETLGPLLKGPEGIGLTGWDLYQMRERFAEREERRRLFYVACTRAADYLLLAASSDNIASPRSEALKMLSERFDLATGSYGGPRPSGMFHAEPQLKITDAEPPPCDDEASRGREGVDLLRMVEKTREMVSRGAQRTATPPRTVRPIGRTASRQRRFSFSRLSGELAALEAQDAAERLEPAGGAVPIERRDGPRRADGMDPRELGTVVHAALERFDFGAESDPRTACEEAGAMLQCSDNVVQEAMRLTAPFVSGPRAAELASARRLLREVEFLLAWGLPEDETTADGLQGPRFLQGVMDCLYLDRDGSWRLIDFKTNRTSADRLAEAAAPYEMQMYVYAEACRRTLGAEPIETTLCFLHTQAEYTFDWTPARRRRAEKNVNRALRAASHPRAT